jgi:hypothetical protein
VDLKLCLMGAVYGFRRTFQGVLKALGGSPIEKELQHLAGATSDCKGKHPWSSFPPLLRIQKGHDRQIYY